MAKGKPWPLAEALNMWRFKEGQFTDDSVAAGVAP
jgi:sarcosine oxidase, subunit beta